MHIWSTPGATSWPLGHEFGVHTTATLTQPAITWIITNCIYIYVNRSAGRNLLAKPTFCLQHIQLQSANLRYYSYKVNQVGVDVLARFPLCY